jgi:hypothetical protein
MEKWGWGLLRINDMVLQNFLDRKLMPFTLIYLIL